MTRSVSAPMLAAAGAGGSRPVYFIEIVWATFSSKLSTYGNLSWNGATWSGESVELGEFDELGVPGSIALIDPSHAYRTLTLTDGARDRPVNIWLADAGALAAGDPVALFSGYADGCEISPQRITIHLDRSQASRQFSPRERIGPAIGVNFTAPPGVVIAWRNNIITLRSRESA